MKYINKGKIIMVPYPAQGHVTPMLKLASALSNLGFEPVVVVPEFIHRSIAPQINTDVTKISCMSIPDGLDEGAARDFRNIEMAMEINMPPHFERLLGALDGVVCVVVDLLASWAIGVAHKCGVRVAGFWPAMLTTYRLIATIPEMVHTGIISETGIPQHPSPLCFEPNQLKLSTEDLPWLIGTPSAKTSRFKFWIRTLQRSKTLSCILINTFPDEHNNNNLITNPLILPIGPLLKNVTGTDNPTFWKQDFSCLNWLDNQKTGSVIYISFGSWVSPIGEEKIKSLAISLEATKRPFIWVLGPLWRHGLPCGYFERVCKRGKIVSWAPQMEVLQHRAVGCFLSHCGWNSTMESIQCKKRMVCYPVAGDQFVNCGYVVNLWRVGVRIGGFGEKEVEEGVRRVMEDEEINGRLMRLNELTMGNEARLRVRDNLSAFVNAISS